MAKRRFLLQGGKGRIGIGGRQVVASDIVPIHEDYTSTLTSINQQLTSLQSSTTINTLSSSYSFLLYTDTVLDDFTNVADSFTRNAYAIIRNSKSEYFLGIDISKNDARLDPRGTHINVVSSEQFGRIIKGSFYCLKDEIPVYENANVKVYNLNPVEFVSLVSGSAYSFSVTREDIVIQKTMLPEYTINIEANNLKFYKDNSEISSIDLSLFIDDTNLSRIISGVVDSNTGIATFSRDDTTSFTVDMSSLLDAGLVNYGNGLTKNGNDIKGGGVLTENIVYQINDGDPRVSNAFRVNNPNETWLFEILSNYLNIDIGSISIQGKNNLELSSKELHILGGESAVGDVSTTDGVDINANNLILHGRDKVYLKSLEIGTPIVGNAIVFNSADGTLGQAPISSNSYGLDIQANRLVLLNNGIQVGSVDLSLYVDDTNLARITNGALNSDTGIATFTRDDNTTFDVDFSSLLSNTSIGLNDLSDAQSDAFNVLIGSKETPDSEGETRGVRNVVVGKNSILDGIGNDNVVIGHSAFSGLGSNGNNNSSNNVVIGSKAATDRVLGNDNVYVGGNTVSGDGSGSNNIVIGANIDIGGNGVNNVLNIGNVLKGDISTKEIEIEKLKLTNAQNGSFNDSILTINTNSEIEKLNLQSFVNIKVYAYNVNPQLNLSALVSQETSYNGGNGIIGAFQNNGANRITVAGKYSTFFHATIGSQNPTSVRYEYRIKINNGLFTTSANGANPVDSILIIAREDLTINGIIDESSYIETQSFPSGQVFSVMKIENIFGTETKTTQGFFLKNIDNTERLNASEANISVMVKVIKTYADETNAGNDNNNVSFRRDNITTFIERIR